MPDLAHSQVIGEPRVEQSVMIQFIDFTDNTHIVSSHIQFLFLQVIIVTLRVNTNKTLTMQQLKERAKVAWAYFQVAQVFEFELDQSLGCVTMWHFVFEILQDLHIAMVKRLR